MSKAGLFTTFVLAMLGLVSSACGDHVHAQPTSTQQPLVTPTPAVAEAARGAQVEAVGRLYKNRTYQYELAVPAGWEVDERNPKGVVLRLPEKGFFLSVGVYESRDLPPAPSTLAGFREGWLSIMKNAMPVFTVLKEEQVVLGKDAALSYEYTWVDRGTKLWAKALIVRRPNYGYEVFGWVAEREWPEFSRAVDDLLATFKLD